MPLSERTHAGSFHRADMNKDVFSAIVGFDEAEAFLRVEPLHSLRAHIDVLAQADARTATAARKTFAAFVTIIDFLERACPS